MGHHALLYCSACDMRTEHKMLLLIKIYKFFFTIPEIFCNIEYRDFNRFFDESEIFLQ